MPDKPSSRGGYHYEKLRLQRQQAQAMEQETVAAALDEKLTEQADKLLKACTSDTKSAAARRSKAAVVFAVYAEAASSVTEAKDAPEETGRFDDCPPWLKYTQSWLRDYVSEAPAEREILLRTPFFNPEMQQSLNRLVFSSVQDPTETPLEYAVGLITGQIDIAV